MPTAVSSSEARTQPRDSQPAGSSSWPVSQRISSWSAATSARSRVASSSRPTSRASTALMLRSGEAMILENEQEGGQPFDG
jgi:hypothetical protein